jgi:hypothetical protein
LATLFDISPASESVTISGHAIPVYGLSASNILMILGRFPDVDAYRDGETDVMKIFLKLGGAALEALIATALGYPNNQEAEQAASRLPAHSQIEIAAATVRLTMPEGATPFLARIGDLFATFGLEASTAPPSETSLPASELGRVYSNGHAPHNSNGAAVQ